MRPALLKLAQSVITAANRERPADLVLRDRLKTERGFSRQESSQISEAVFAYFRWLKWSNEEDPISARIERALALAWDFQRDPRAFRDEDLIEKAVPDWVTEQMPVTPNWARALQAEPRLWLRTRPAQGQAFAQHLGDCQVFGEGRLSDILEYRGEEDLFRTREFHQGHFELQDISSQAVGFVCAPEPKSTWWDACAGEGGKMLHLADLMDNRGMIWASDRALWRLQKLKRRAARAKVFNYRVASWDGGPKLPTKTKFDGVLIDAPCSGVGTWHRNPHARWTTTPEDVQELAQLQLQLLMNAAAAVKPGGKLVYAVCTLLRAETTEVVARFSREQPSFERVALANPLKPESAPKPELYLWPQHHGGNGMFIAVWKKTEGTAVTKVTEKAQATGGTVE